MRKFISFIAVALVFSAIQSADALERIAFIDMERVFQEFHKTQLADAQLKRQAREFAQERDVLVEQAEALRDEHNELRSQAMDPAISDEAREDIMVQVEEKLVEFREKENEINEFNQLRAKQLEDQGRRMRENIVEEIQSVINRYARNNNHIAVIDSSSQSLNAIDVVLFVDTRYDITDDVIELLNN